MLLNRGQNVAERHASHVDQLCCFVAQQHAICRDHDVQDGQQTSVPACEALISEAISSETSFEGQQSRQA